MFANLVIDSCIQKHVNIEMNAPFIMTLTRRVTFGMIILQHAFVVDIVRIYSILFSKCNFFTPWAVSYSLLIHGSDILDMIFHYHMCK